MSKKLYSQKIKEVRDSSFGAVQRVCSFEEKPPRSRFEDAGCGRKGETLRAHELFSIFTADIIKQEIVFTR